MNFSLMHNDPKADFCQPFNYAKIEGGDLYRILPSETIANEMGAIEYKCEHVFAMLIDNVLFGEHIVGNIGYNTRSVIQYVLAHQLSKMWTLGECDFNHQYEYAWSHETLLSSLFSIPYRFSEKYMWTFNTDCYPFVLNLKALNGYDTPIATARWGANLIQLIKSHNPSNVCTRLYALGQGEGVNQANICSVNNGLPYLQSPPSIVKKYGIIERIWIDRRYTHPQSLLETAAVMLKELQEPIVEYNVDLVDLPFNGTKTADILGKTLDIEGEYAYITAVKRVYGEIPKITITIANKPANIAGTLADMQDRQRIEVAYAQGATQFYQDHVYENADASNSLTLKLMIPEQMVIVNKVCIDVEISEFRKPFAVTGGGGAQTTEQSSTTTTGQSSATTTSAGGGSYASTSASDEAITTTNEGGGTYASSDYASISSGSVQVDDDRYNIGKHNHGLPHGAKLMVDNGNWRVDGTGKVCGGTYYAFAPSGAHNHGSHNHSINVPAHSHTIRISPHTHNINVANHSHTMEHTHDVSHTHKIPDHVHTLIPGISHSGNPTSFSLIIDGKHVKNVFGRELRDDITSLLLGKDNTIKRNVYHKIEILPNDAAYVMLTINVQGFIQSRGDMTV